MFCPIPTQLFTEVVWFRYCSQSLLRDDPDDTQFNVMKMRENAFDQLHYNPFHYGRCSRYPLMSFSLIFCSNQFLSCNEHTFLSSCVTDRVISFTKIYCCDTFRYKFCFGPFKSFSRSRRPSLLALFSITLSAAVSTLGESVSFSISSSSLLNGC